MRIKFLKNPAIRNFALIALAIFALMLVLNLINQRFVLNDFKVMYLAAKALLSNEQVYGVPFGLDSGFYKYSPFTLLFFTPYALFPFGVASFIHYFVIVIAVIFVVVLLEQLISTYLFTGKEKTWVALFLILFSILLHMERELYLGNTNTILLVLAILGLKFMMLDKPLPSGMLWAIVVLTKPYFVVCLLPLLLHRKWKLMASIAGSMLAFVFISMLFVGFPKGVGLYSDWLLAMADHNSYLSSYNTIFKLLRYYLGISVPSSYYILLYGLVGLLSLVFFWFIDRKAFMEQDKIQLRKSLLIHIFILIALAPSMLITDKEHFQFSLPLLAILILQLRKTPKPLWIALFIGVMIMYEGNSIEVIGRPLSILFDDLGLLGISNLIIMGAVFFLYAKQRHLWGLKEK